MLLGESCCRPDITFRPANRRPQPLCNMFGDWRNGLTPGRRGLRQLFDELRHQAACAGSLFKEPFASEGLVNQPIEHVGIHDRPDWFHHVARKAVSGIRVHVHHAEAGVETERTNGKVRGRLAVKEPLKRRARTGPINARRVKRVTQRDRVRTVHRLKVPTPKGTRTIAVTRRKDRSLVGRYWNAVHKRAARGDASALIPFENAFVTDVHGRRIRLLTDLRTLDQLAAAGVLSFESIYGRRI
jgi:hypothetical protein